MGPATKQKALAALDGMREIVRNEMAVPGAYVTPVVDVGKAAAGAICGGRHACAVGSLWIAAGVEVVASGDNVWLPGADSCERESFLRRRHGLRVAYNALNDAAQRLVDRRKIDLDDYSYMPKDCGPMERLFEADRGGLDRRDLLGIIASAKRTILAS